MKKIYITFKVSLMLLGFFILYGCVSSTQISPSKNKALGVITNTKKEKSYSMQKSLDQWLNERWTPTIEKNSTIKKINNDKKRDFTLQEYVDKVKVYLRENNETKRESHWQKVNSLPVIGK